MKKSIEGLVISQWIISVCFFIGFVGFWMGMLPKKSQLKEKYNEKIIEIYERTNAIAKGDTNQKFQVYLSKAMQSKVSQLPFIEKYMIAKGTKNGTLLKSEVVGKKEINKDSIVVKMKLYFQDETTQTIEQPLVYENKKWLIGLSFERQ